MRQLKWLTLGVFFFLPNLLHAGQIYGFIASSSRVHVRTAIQVDCLDGQVWRPSGSGMTADDGSYRINVARNGQCLLKLPQVPGGPAARVFSYPNPVQYNFQLVGQANGYALRRR